MQSYHAETSIEKMWDDVARVFSSFFRTKIAQGKLQCQGEREICMSVQIKGRGKTANTEMHVGRFTI